MMSFNPDHQAETRKGNRTERINQWSRQLFSASGWLVLLTAIVLALRPTALPSPLTVDDSPTPSASTTTGRPNPHIGPLDAPITIVEFGDFACPACGVWNESGTIERILEKYSDKVRFVWADFPSVTLASPDAAEAARCAYDQGKFWEYHDYLYAHMEALGKNDLKVYASLLGLDRTEFDSCLDTEARKAEISLDFQDAVYRQVGVLPTFFIQTSLGEQRLVGPPTFEQLVAIIDPLLARNP
jgi:protein-disulfide isomerase